jgi:plasmid stability protein
MHRLSVALDDDLSALIQSRADMNKRSMSKEVIFLIEAALSAEHGSNLEILRTLMIAQGGVSQLSPSQS